jgi:hypothetical protein
MQRSLHSRRPRRHGLALATAVAAAALAATSGIASTAGPAAAKGGAGAPTPQVIAFPSRDFVSVAEPGGTTPTTTWTHPGAVVQTSTSTVPGVAPALGLNDINHVDVPCWSSSLTPATSNMGPGDSITVDVPGGPANQQLAMTVADVTTVQARLATGSSTKVVVTGSAKDPVTGRQVAPGLLEARLIAKKQQFTFNGRRDLRAAVGGGGDGVLSYDDPGSTTNFGFTATFELLGGRNTTTALATADAQQAISAQTRGLVQNDPVNPTWITIYETHVAGDGVVHGNAPGCPSP